MYSGWLPTGSSQQSLDIGPFLSMKIFHHFNIQHFKNCLSGCLVKLQLTSPQQNKCLEELFMSAAQKYQFIFTCGHIFVPNGCYLILNFVSAKSFVEGMHDFVSLVTTSSPVKAGHDHFLCAGQVCGPSHPEPEI